uniref:Uncharacterized protein n=1 Tax=Anguilla anguilla TaxID=7936 RepID=A0A0E9P8Y5_ANGAN
MLSNDIFTRSLVSHRIPLAQSNSNGV